MIKLFYCRFDHWPSEQEFEKKLFSLPESIINKINQYNNYEDKVLRLAGKLLLQEAFKGIDIANKLSLTDILLNDNGKPVNTNHSIYFNTAYSGNIAICIINTSGETGIDIEKIIPVDLSLYQDYFTLKEWNNINAINDMFDSYLQFFHLWTRKEAILKASGNGLLIPLNTIEVLDSIVNLNNKTYYLQTINLHKDFICHIATEVLYENVTTIEINLF